MPTLRSTTVALYLTLMKTKQIFHFSIIQFSCKGLLNGKHASSLSFGNPEQNEFEDKAVRTPGKGTS